MSRYTGPRVKVIRALGVDLPGLTRKTMERRPYPPGQHGQNRRRKLSEFALRLIEKQKLKLNYGLTERQMVNLVRESRATKGNTGQRLLEYLERRLDNVVFRAGFARTIPGARQLVAHGHVLVNGRRVDIPSFRVAANHVVSLHERSRQLASVQAALGAPPPFETPWLAVDGEKREVRVVVLPDASAVPFEINVQRVIEYYAQRI